MQNARVLSQGFADIGASVTCNPQLRCLSVGYAPISQMLE